MKIHRAHSYDAVERLRAELDRVPERWRCDAEPYKFLVLPDDLRPSWIGLTLRSDEEIQASARAYGSTSHEGRTQDEVGGWAADEDHSYWVRDTPHIYLNHSSLGFAVHEVAHTLAWAWHVDLRRFYRPERALYPYMAADADEFWACALDAFLTLDNHDKRWNRLDLAAKAPELHDFLRQKLRG